MSFFSRDCRVVPCVTCHVCASLAAKRCSDVVLVWMHLEITNNDLFATVTGDDGEDVNVHDANADSSSTAVETDVSDGKSDGKTEAKVDPIAAWEAQFRFKEYRLPQDSLELRERIKAGDTSASFPIALRAATTVAATTLSRPSFDQILVTRVPTVVIGSSELLPCNDSRRLQRAVIAPSA